MSFMHEVAEAYILYSKNNISHRWSRFFNCSIFIYVRNAWRLAIQIDVTQFFSPWICSIICVFEDIISHPNHVKVFGDCRPVRLRSVSCGKHHTLAISEDRQLYGWGRSQMIASTSSKQLNTPCPTPECLHHLCGRKVIQVNYNRLCYNLCAHTQLSIQQILNTPLQSRNLLPKGSFCSLLSRMLSVSCILYWFQP